MHLRVINMAGIKGMHRIVFGIHLFSSPCLLVLTFAFSPRGSVPPMMTLLQGAKVDFSHHYHLCALVCLHVQKIHPFPFSFSPRFMLIILSIINYSGHPVLIQALITVNIRTLQKTTTILSQTVNIGGLLRHPDSYSTLM